MLLWIGGLRDNVGQQAEQIFATAIPEFLPQRIQQLEAAESADLGMQLV